MQRLPNPILIIGLKHAVILSPDGEMDVLPHGEALRRLRDTPPPVVCHRPAVERRLGSGPMRALDVLELFAFVRPARFCLPTVNGLADALDLERASHGASHEDEARLLLEAARTLLTELEEDGDEKAATIARTMEIGGWPWGAAVCAALSRHAPRMDRSGGRSGLEVWRTLPEWAEHAPEPPPGNQPVEPAEARQRLAKLVGPDAESRPEQANYASALCSAFEPRAEEDAPNVVLADAGTGVGKTLGYIAPASLWAEKNDGPVWISTYTRNLQRQIDGELDRLYPDPVVKARRVVIRKGRENYLCLLSLEEAAGRLGARAEDAVALGLTARWTAATRDGDMMGGDFPAWLADLVGPRNTLGLTDRRGECIYSACTHYHRCFIERAARRSRRADIVVANHALVMTHAATGGLDDGRVPTRLVFDEGHHVFDAADSAFSAHLSGQEGADLRHWLLGAEEGRQSRSRGLRRRIEDVAGSDEATETQLAALLEAAQALPGPGWRQRLANGMPQGPAERFLAGVRQQVYARARYPDSPYDLETDTAPLVEGLADSARLLEEELARIVAPMRALAARLTTVLDEQSDDLDTPTRNRIDAVGRGLRRRGEGQVEPWRTMLDALSEGTPETFVDWFSVTRIAGRDADVGMHRHWIDPTIPFAASVVVPSHGTVVTSATLRDGTGDADADWRAAEARSGALHLAHGAVRAHAPSPFDYAGQTRVLVVRDVRKDDLNQVAAAYRALFAASGGGALGLFTAVARLRAVHGRIAPALEEAGIELLAQHVDGLDIASLIDIFRAEEDTCLLGTDAVRDGVDVPGRSLRLIVFDRVPWPRPDILHRARRKHFAETRYDDMIARLRLKQAYGRLVRRAGDRGVFVILDPMMPSRLAGAFPEGVEIGRMGLAEAVAETRAFLS